MKKSLVILAGLALMAAQAAPVWAAETAAEEEGKAKAVHQGEMVVTATMTEEDINKVPSTTFVVTDQEIKEKAQWSLMDALRDVPGVYIHSNGPFGGSTSLTMRGTQPGQTMLMLDGVRLSDPISTSGPWIWPTCSPAASLRSRWCRVPSPPCMVPTPWPAWSTSSPSAARASPADGASAVTAPTAPGRATAGAQGQLDRFNFMLSGRGHQHRRRLQGQDRQRGRPLQRLPVKRALRL